MISIHATCVVTSHEKMMLKRQIAATDHQLDQLVYALYNLTADEIKIVEGARVPGNRLQRES